MVVLSRDAERNRPDSDCGEDQDAKNEMGEVATAGEKQIYQVDKTNLVDGLLAEVARALLKHLEVRQQDC